jgi:hypothetical protein
MLNEEPKLDFSGEEGLGRCVFLTLSLLLFLSFDVLVCCGQWLVPWLLRQRHQLGCRIIMLYYGSYMWAPIA